jgi:hypothetical protein
MEIEDSVTLKTYFTTGQSPTQSHFENLIESFINKKDAGITVQGNNIGIGLEAGESPTERLKVKGAISIGNTTNTHIQSGTIRWNPAANSSEGDLEGYDGNEWRSLISGGGWEDEGAYSYTENSITIGESRTAPTATVDINGTLRLKNEATLEGEPGTLRWDGSDLKLKMTPGDEEVNWTSLTQTNVFTKIKVFQNENMGIGLDDNDIPQARVHMKGPVKIEGSLEVTERLHYKGRINETVGDASTPRVLEETNETPFGNPFGDKISYTFTKATRVMIEANLPFLNGNCTAKVALCYKIGSGSETIIDEAVITVSTSVHNRLKLSGYLNIPENTTVEFYTKIVARESGEVRLNSDSDSLKQFNCFGTIQLIEI